MSDVPRIDLPGAFAAWLKDALEDSLQPPLDRETVSRRLTLLNIVKKQAVEFYEWERARKAQLTVEAEAQVGDGSS